MKNRKLIHKFLQIITISLCTLPVASLYADTSDDKAVLASTACLNTDDCLASGYGVSLRALLFQPTYNQANSMVAGSILRVIFMPHDNGTMTMSSPTSLSILNVIANKGNVADQFLASVPEIFAPGLVLLPTSSQSNIPFIRMLPFASSNQQQPTAADQQSALNTLNFDSVFTPMAYHEVTIGNNQNNKSKMDQRLVANTFIQYVTGLANPMRTSDFTAAKYPTDKYTSLTAYLYDLQKNPDVRDYLTALRTYTAQISVGLSNYYYLYHERMPITDPTLLQQATAVITPPPNSSIAPPPKGPLSPLQMEHYLANRRISDPNWYTAMQNALPSTLLRETLFLIAEIPPILFQIHLDLERILATMSAMQIQQANGSTLFLQQQRDKVDKILQNSDQAQTEAATNAEQAQQAAQQAELQQAKQALSGTTNNTNNNR